MYEEFRPGSIRVVPGASGLVALARDYQAMRDMIFGEPPAFDDIIAELERVQARINAQNTTTPHQPRTVR